MTERSQSRKTAFAITERDGKTYWTKVGIAYVNRDGSLNVILDALPVSGKLQIRDDDQRNEPG